MRFKDVLSTAYRNIVIDKKSSRKMIKCVMLFFFLACTYINTMNVLSDYLDDFEINHEDARYVFRTDLKNVAEAEEIYGVIKHYGMDTQAEIVLPDKKRYSLDEILDSVPVPPFVFKVYFDSFSDIAELAGNKISYFSSGKIDLNLLGADEMNLTSEGGTYCTVVWIVDNIGFLLIIVGIICVVVIIAAMAYAIFFFRNRNSKYYTMLRVIGMQERDLRKIELFEAVLVSAIALVLAIYLTFMFCLVLNYFTEKLIQYSVQVHYGMITLSLLVCEVIFLLLNRIIKHKIQM
ncbi:MAG: hypothetical protein IKP88_09270 [Lachnospiraceae bacterium]|nr:hypothetical protein [Lachnospiraceae bacterium]